MADTTLVQSNVEIVEDLKQDSTFFNRYYNDKDYSYSNSASTSGKTLRNRFWDWVDHILHKIDSLINLPFKLSKLFLLMVIAALIWAGFKLIKFNKKGEQKDDYKMLVDVNDTEENLQDYGQAIKHCLDQADYRKAIRFQYLELLFKLNDAGIINIAINNTNNDIQREIERKQISPALFNKIKKAYNAIWYGNYEIDIEDYQQINLWYSAFIVSIKNFNTNS